MNNTVNVKEVKIDLTQLLNKVCCGGERYIIQKEERINE